MTPHSVPKLCCPSCAGFLSRVLESRPTPQGDAYRRSRKCLDCGTCYTTSERIVRVIPRRGDPPSTSTTHHI